MRTLLRQKDRPLPDYCRSGCRLVKAIGDEQASQIMYKVLCVFKCCNILGIPGAVSGGVHISNEMNGWNVVTVKQSGSTLGVVVLSQFAWTNTTYCPLRGTNVFRVPPSTALPITVCFRSSREKQIRTGVSMKAGLYFGRLHHKPWNYCNNSTADS